MLLYVTTRFDRESIERMLGHFRTLLEAIAVDPERCVFELPLATDAERRQLLADWNQTAMPYASDVCVHELVEQWAAQSPDAPGSTPARTNASATGSLISSRKSRGARSAEAGCIHRGACSDLHGTLVRNGGSYSRCSQGRLPVPSARSRIPKTRLRVHDSRFGFSGFS